MKLSGNFKSWAVTQSLLAKILELSVPRVNQLIDEEIVLRDETDKGGAVLLIDSLRNYYLSKNPSGESVSFWKEKSLHEKANREMAELKLAERRGQLYEASIVEGVFIEIVVVLKNQLLGLPTKLAADLEGKSKDEIYARLTSELESALSELSKSYNGAEFKEEQ